MKIDKYQILKENILIPRTTFWMLVITIIIGILSNFIFSWNRVKHIEKEIEVSKTKFEKELKIHY
jgi:hypothetical protein